MRFISLCLILCLCACSSTPPADKAPQNRSQAVIDPTDAQLIDTLAKYTVRSGAPAASGFKYVRIDLNGDRRRDALVYLHSPFGYWCKKHGCAMLIFEAHNKGFRLVNKTQPIRPPIYVSRIEKTNGWATLITRVSGRNKDAKNVALRFNGRTYPSNPENLPAHDVFIGMNPNYIRALDD